MYRWWPLQLRTVSNKASSGWMYVGVLKLYWIVTSSPLVRTLWIFRIHSITISITYQASCQLSDSNQRFPYMRESTDVHAWFGLVNQVAYAFAGAEVIPRLTESRSSPWRKTWGSFSAIKESYCQSNLTWCKDFLENKTNIPGHWLVKHRNTLFAVTKHHGLLSTN